jgi:hypothetical protein
MLMHFLVQLSTVGHHNRHGKDEHVQATHDSIPTQAAKAAS